MVDPITAELWGRRALLMALITLAVFIKLLPLQTGASSLPWPDVILCLMTAWTIRRPELVPLWMVVAVGFITDMVFLRPPGVWALILILGFEGLRAHARREGTMSAASEAGAVLVLFTSAFLANRLFLLIFAVPQPNFGATVLELLASLMLYPLVALVTVFIFRVRRPDPTDLQGLRGRG